MIGNAFIMNNYTNKFDKALDDKQCSLYEFNSKMYLFIT